MNDPAGGGRFALPRLGHVGPDLTLISVVFARDSSQIFEMEIKIAPLTFIGSADGVFSKLGQFLSRLKKLFSFLRFHGLILVRDSFDK